MSLVYHLPVPSYLIVLIGIFGEVCLTIQYSLILNCVYQISVLEVLGL